MLKKRMPVGRKATGKPGRHNRLLLLVVLDNRPDTGVRARARKGADVGR
jgi:hypothetical protein